MDRHQAEPEKRQLSYYEAGTSLALIEGSIGSALLTAAAQFGGQAALIDGQVDISARRVWSYAELADQAAQVAHALSETFETGDRVAIWASNSPEWALVEFGASLAGLVLVTVNPAYLEHELQHVLVQSEACGIILEDNYRGRDLPGVLARIRPDIPNLRSVIRLSDRVWLRKAGAADRLPRVGSQDIAQIQYTSGTTGFPKGACLTHRGLSNNARFYAQTIGARAQDVWINAMPMFHTAGCGLATLGAVQTGGTLVMAPGFEAGHMLDLFEQQRGTIMLCVPTMLIRMLEEQERTPRDLSTWRLVTLGGAPVPPELVRRTKEVIGADVAIGFGQTEASPYITHTLPNDPHPAWFETVGKPLPCTEVKIVDPATGETVNCGTSGEICARGYGLMTGYYNAAEATAATIDEDGWLHTGDVGSMDTQGYCRVLGRLRDMIIRGGENVYPREIEDVLMTHPRVADVAVIGMPDPDWGETVAACIRPAGPGKPDPADLERFCRERLASYKVPRAWHFLDDMPQTASGKIQKFILRDQLLASQVSQAAPP